MNISTKRIDYSTYIYFCQYPIRDPGICFPGWHPGKQSHEYGLLGLDGFSAVEGFNELVFFESKAISLFNQRVVLRY